MILAKGMDNRVIIIVEYAGSILLKDSFNTYELQALIVLMKNIVVTVEKSEIIVNAADNLLWVQVAT